MLGSVGDAREERLDFLRVLALFQPVVEEDTDLNQSVADHLIAAFPDSDREIRWEQARLPGAYGISKGFAKLLEQLETERDPVTRFHIAQAICKLSNGWSRMDEERLLRWILGTQTGWFAEFEVKGVEFKGPTKHTKDTKERQANDSNCLQSVGLIVR